MGKTYLISCIVAVLYVLNVDASNIIWQIGKADNSASEFALGPSEYKKFLSKDFGYEDRYFLIGYSKADEDFPYVLPGPNDVWGGTWRTSGWRTHSTNILFGLDRMPECGEYRLIVDLLDADPKRSLVKISINSIEKKFEIKGKSEKVLDGIVSGSQGVVLEVPVAASDLKNGGNIVTISVLEGGWIVFDQVRLEGSRSIALKKKSNSAFLRNVSPAEYELKQCGSMIQPLLVDIEHLSGKPDLTVKLDGKLIFSSELDTARYIFEVPMPAVKKKVKSKYQIFSDGKLLESGIVLRSPQKEQTLADYVDTKMGTAHSRWMIAPGPWMPFSMVKLSPDNQNKGWQAGYQPTFETIGCFSHIHEWTMAGLGMMPTNGELYTKVGDQFCPDKGYRSRIEKRTEEAPLGYYKVFLADTQIKVEATATERASFQRYSFPQDKDGRVMIDLHIQAEYDYKLFDVDINKVSNKRIEGCCRQVSSRIWGKDAEQEYVVNFVIEFDAPIKKVGGWKNDEVFDTSQISGEELSDAGLFVEFDTKKYPIVQLRTGLSYVSVSNASENLNKEISERFGWDFDAVVKYQKKVWNSFLNRVVISTNDRLEKIRFYSNMYRALCRNLFSDVNGEWVSADEKVRKLSNPDHLALGCDAFWNTFWNLNQFWNLVTPEWSSKWVNSQLAMYDSNGWLAKGPAGMEYIPVMVAEHEIPLIVSAYQMGIRDFDSEKAFNAMKKMQTTPAVHIGGGFAGNRDLVEYLKYRYVPIEKGRFSNSLEYSYDDWTVGQMAKALGKSDDYNVFNERGYWWKNAINPETGYAHMRRADGKFVSDFDPFLTGRNQHYVEGNAWQLTFFVPQDVPALIETIGEKNFVERLNWGFEVSEQWRYNAPNDQYWNYPVVQGNQQSMHFAFLFNWAKKPWLTQKWSRSIIDRYYGSGVANAYLGDEDQGQMSAWFVMAALGLFQTDGGCRVNPIYEIGSPLFEKVVINLGGLYGRGDCFVIEAKNVSRKNKYIQSAVLNGKTLNSFYFQASELLKGGKLILVMGDKPNHLWGI
ncbi:GH92 family glycosyl hydrolase [Bacteroides xylanisolvens]|uniref:GH92 family glycosyl hydrolase n=1 Tax=Bacteroides xylanisolvens TaxID=371601 RepID=UPI001896CF80|nr:GH92 family glycosyl hydrolase [Bacteroides xylanisolvens]